jgi:fatty acid desaturase
MDTRNANPPDATSIPDRETLAALHGNDEAPLLRHGVANAALLTLVAASWWTWNHGYWPVTMLTWLGAGYVAYTKAQAFHEAAHGTLHHNQALNELHGMLMGILILVPLSVYRHAHWQHHRHLAERVDPELWPFVIPGAPRWSRMTAAVLELSIGFIYTPLLFVRSVIVGWRSLPLHRRVVILAESVCLVCFWSATLALIASKHWWPPFLVCYVAPALVAGAAQTVNKYVQHMGLFGDSDLSSTRTVADPRRFGQALSSSMLHVVHHGTHHRYAQIPFYKLPAATAYVYDATDPNEPVFSSYWDAMMDMIPVLRDPRIGRQWL